MQYRISTLDIGELFEKSLPKEEYFSQALYTFDIGQNDITAGYKLNWTAEQVKANLPYVLTQLSNAIKVDLSFVFISCFLYILTISSSLARDELIVNVSETRNLSTIRNGSQARERLMLTLLTI